MPISRFLRPLLLLLCLGLVLPLGVRADEAPEPAKPAEDPAKPDDDPEKPPEIVREGDVPEPTEDEGEDDQPTPEVATGRKAEQKEFENAATPAGMVYVPGGTAVIGTTYERLRQELLRGRARQVQADFAFEAPQHQVEMKPFFIDRYEVTNAQYLLFMEGTKQSYDTDEAALANIVEVAGYLMGMPRDQWESDDVAWGQLYETNKDVLWEKMPDKVVKNAAGEVDEKATKKAFRYAPLVRGMELTFYSRKPPETWPSMLPLKIMMDHPVMSVSYDDAEAYAEWAGKHVPTEQEWEYAGRGPEGFFYPWGDQWFSDLTHCNWGAKNATEDTGFKPRTMVVDSIPEGRSWCGAYHMLGNAGEWTSSWFMPYPGNEREHVSMGEYVKVIRGATYVDLELLVLRLAARNFIGSGIKAPPRPGNRFGYIGFRCAWYEQPGLDQLGPIVRRVSRGRHITSQRVDTDRYAGGAATKFAPSDATPENHVYVQGRAHSIVLIPLKSMIRGDVKEPKIRSRKALKKESAESVDPFPLAVFHTDIPLEKVYVRRPLTEEEEKKLRKKKKPEPPPVDRGTCAPGTYVLGVWHTRLCLCTEALEWVCFLSENEAKTDGIDIVKMKPEDRQAAKIEVEPDVDAIFIGLELPVGGEKTDENLFVKVKSVPITPKKGALTEAGTWRVHSRADD